MPRPNKPAQNKGTLTFGQRVKKARQAANLTLREAADRLTSLGEGRVSHQAVQNWEVDRTGTPLWRVPQLAKIYGCSQAFLMGQEDSLGDPIIPSDMAAKVKTTFVMLETVLEEEGVELDTKRKAEMLVLALRQEPDEGFIRGLVRIAG